LQSYAEREHGKVVVYTTSMGVVRQTFQRCLQVQRILGTLLINYEERDVSMNRQVQQELKERMNRNRIVIPQVFVEGQLLGVSHTLFYFLFLSLSLSHVRNDRLSPAQTLLALRFRRIAFSTDKMCKEKNLSNDFDLVNFALQRDRLGACLSSLQVLIPLEK
jgi:glutaredoxin